jgi:hypothetical protein
MFKGFIQTRNGDLLSVRSIGSISDYSEQVKGAGIEWCNIQKLDSNRPVTCVTCDGGVWYFQMTVQQVAALMLEADNV